MKILNKIIILSALTMLTACSFLDEPSVTKPEDNTEEPVNNNGGNTTNPNQPNNGGEENNNNNNNQNTGVDTTIRIYATNDIHGQVYPEEEAARVGIGKLMTFLKNKKETEENVLLLDQGDTWQGSIYSNYNHGACITDIMNYVHYDARTIGNHDFDWGVDPIKVNTAREYQGYKTPVLAGNIYDYNFDTKTVGNTQQSDLGVPSVTYTVANGVKVGVVGVIGKDQITSINSLYTRGIAFTDHVSVIKSEATKLRNEGCNIVICSVHAGQEAVLNQGLSDYVDLVLCGHTHKKEFTTEGGLLFGQYGQYTEGVGYIEFKYNSATQKVTRTGDLMYKYGTINSMVTTVDPTIQSIIDTYRQDCDEQASEKIVYNVPNEFNTQDECSYMMAKAVYDTAIAEGYDVDCSYVNQPRHALPSGQWTFADIYEAFPFDNVIYIIDVPARDYKAEVWKYNWICKSNTESIAFTSTDTIKIACLDYLAFHTNANRSYDYFKSVVQYTDIDTVPHLQKNYREVLVDWLKANDYDKEGHPLYDYQFSDSEREFNRWDLACEMIPITYHLYNEVTQIGQGRYLFDFAADRIDNPSRSSHEFLGWYFDSACTTPIHDDYEMTVAFDAYAKWKELSPQYYYTDEMWMGYFPEERNENAVAAINCDHDLTTINYTYTTVTHDVQYYEFGLGVGGYINFTIPSGFKLYAFTVDIYKFDNLLFYGSFSRDDSSLITGIQKDDNSTNGHFVYDKSGLALDQFTIYNKYTNGSALIRYVKLTLEKVSA